MTDFQSRVYLNTASVRRQPAAASFVRLHVRYIISCHKYILSYQGLNATKHEDHTYQRAGKVERESHMEFYCGVQPAPNLTNSASEQSSAHLQKM